MNCRIKNPLNYSLMALLLVSLTIGSGCDIKMPWDPKPDPKAAKDAKAEEPAEAPPAAEEESGPPDETALLPPAMKNLPYEEVTIPLKDQLIIYGRLYDPSMKPEGEEGDTAAAASEDEEYKGPKYPLIILLHGLNRDHVVWSDLPASLVKAGYAVYAMDLRGHGKSLATTHKHKVNWRLLKPEDWQKLPKDVGEVIQYFQKGEDYPQVDGNTVGLIGEKLGANVAVYTARDKHDAVKALVLISPGLDYKGIIPSQAIVDYTNPALLIAGQDDPYSYQSTERLYNWLLGPKAMQVYKKIGSGSDMLSNRTSLGSQITEWLTHKMPSPQAPKTAAEPKPAESATADTAHETHATEPAAKTEH